MLVKVLSSKEETISEHDQKKMLPSSLEQRSFRGKTIFGDRQIN